MVMGCIFTFFFFERKTAYDSRLSVVGSEMCIGDSLRSVFNGINPNLCANPSSGNTEVFSIISLPLLHILRC